MHRSALVLLAALVALPAAGFAVDGALDDSFWTDGRVALGTTGDYAIRKILAAPGGGLVVVGTRLVESGSDDWFWRFVGDTTAGTTCYFLPPGGATAGDANTVAFDPAGRLVVAGSARYGSNRLAVARFDYPACALDDSFDGDGFYTLDIAGGPESILAMDLSDLGHLTFGGYHHDGTDSDMVVLQLDDDGAPVTTFSGNGWLTLDISGAELDDGIQALEVDAQHRVVAAGSTHYGASGNNSDFIAVRFTPAGLLDSGFDGDGIARVAFDLGGSEQRYDEPYAMQIDRSTGAIVLAGYAQTVSTNDLAVARLTSTGAPDTTFSTDGKLNNNFGFSLVRANALQIDGLGRITIAGVAEPWDGTSGRDFFVARFLAGGAVDNGFSTNGWTTVPFDLGPGVYVHDTATSAAFDAGRLALVGEATNDTDNHMAYAVARLEIALIFADGFGSGSVRQWSDWSGFGP